MIKNSIISDNVKQTRAKRTDIYLLHVPGRRSGKRAIPLDCAVPQNALRALGVYFFQVFVASVNFALLLQQRAALCDG